MAQSQVGKMNFRNAELLAKKMSGKLAPVIGNIAQRHFQENFDKEGFVDDGLKKWPEVERRMPGTRAYRYGKLSSRTRPILRGSGTPILSNSIRVLRATSRRIEVGTTGTANKYAEVHNAGIGRMKKRQFVGNSRILNEKFEKRIKLEIDNVLASVVR